MIAGDYCNTNLFINCIDSSNKIGLSIVPDDKIYYDCTKNKSARTCASFNIMPEIDIETQHILVESFNTYLNENRDKYHSLFLNSYREFSRKRISFQLVYNLMNHILSNVINI